MKDVYNFLENDIKLNNKDVVICASSHGPDSMMLLNILLHLSKKHHFTLICAHVDHNLREESLEEANKVEKFCKENGIIFEKYTIEKSKTKPITEAQARTIRYDFFDKLAKKYKANYLATAHHADDLIETIMMKIVRGSSLRGYSGFAKVSNRGKYKIIRPLVYITKQDILDYDKENKIDYSIDKSNHSEKYTRNRYRKNMLPFLKAEDKNVHKKFIQFNEKLLKYDDYVSKQAALIKKDIFKDNKLDLNKYNKLDEIIKEEIIHQIISEIYGDNIDLVNSRHINNIYKMIENKRPNVSINLPREIVVIKQYDELVFKKQEENLNYKIVLDKSVKLINGMTIEKVKTIDNNSNYMTRLNSKELKMPLIVRTIESQDTIILKGLKKHKKVKDIYINEKISTEQRKIQPIVVDSENNIVWIPGIKKSVFDKSINEEYDIILRYF